MNNDLCFWERGEVRALRQRLKLVKENQKNKIINSHKLNRVGFAGNFFPIIRDRLGKELLFENILTTWYLIP